MPQRSTLKGKFAFVMGGGMIKRFKYANEYQFWYFLARLDMKNYQGHIPGICNALNSRVQELKLPLKYDNQRSLSWAVLCQLFVITRTSAGPLTKLGFNQMLSGFEKIIAPKRILYVAHQRISANIESSSSLGQTEKESIAKTFLKNALMLDENAKTTLC